MFVVSSFFFSKWDLKRHKGVVHVGTIFKGVNRHMQILYNCTIFETAYIDAQNTMDSSMSLFTVDTLI